jgi:hypothetical protein
MFHSSESSGHRDCGHCGACRWWQSDEHAAAGHDPVGLCEQPELVHFQLMVSADSCCNRFQHAVVGVGADHGEHV